MQGRKTLLVLLTILLTFSIVLAACGAKETGSTPPPNSEGEKKEGEKKEEAVSGPKEGGVVTYAVEGTFEGLFEPALSSSTTDSMVTRFMYEDMFTFDENLQMQPHIATWETDDNVVYTLKIKEGVKWHNGEELTVEDWKFVLEVIAHPDYTGPRFNYVRHIVGAEEMKDGKADSISGVEILDPYTMKITFLEPQVNNLEQLWSKPMPKKHLEGIEIAKLEEAEQIRMNPVGLGPFKVKSVVPGEHVVYERFDDYWQGKPYLDGVTVKIIDSSVVVGELKNESVHIIRIKNVMIPEIKTLSSVDVHSTKGLVYYYVAFKLGHYDKEQRVNIMDNPKFQNKNLRKAMYYAIDREGIIDAYFGGLAEVVNTPVPSVHWIKADESTLTQYNYDPEKAKQLLAEAGYKDIDGDGFVEDPEGNKLQIRFHHQKGDASFEGRAQALTQNWRDIGLDVELQELKDPVLHYDLIEADDPSIDMFWGGWSTGSDPDPKGLWYSTDLWNYPRWVNKESDELLDRALSPEAFDVEKRKQLYIEWQKIVNEELPMLPLFESKDSHAINKKLKGVTIDWSGNQRDMHKWYLEQ